MNRTAKQLQEFIIFLKDEIVELREKIKEPEVSTEVQTEQPTQLVKISERIDHIQKVVAERLTESDKRLQRIDNDIDQYLRAKPYSMVNPPWGKHRHILETEVMLYLMSIHELDHHFASIYPPTYTNQGAISSNGCWA